MQVLGLSGNKLSGEIPTSIGNLTQLFTLELGEKKIQWNHTSNNCKLSKFAILKHFTK